ncbi:MAG: terminase large subunit [Actinobacteria bacterium]|nr:terminase large subunit [Actinomycetota bacterium]
MWPPAWLTPVPQDAIDRGDGDFLIRFADAFGTITKDSVAGRSGEKLVLREWQKDLLRHVFARDEDGGLRSRIALLGLPRKNGKSALGSVIAAFALMDVKTQGAEIYSVAADRQQARIVFEDTKKMIQNSELAEHVKIYRDSILVPATNNVYRVLSADAPRHEGLSPTMVIFDELHAQPNRKLWDVMSLAQGARGKQAMMIAITTAGVKIDSDGKDSVAYTNYNYGKKIISGEVNDPTFFMAWWEAPPEADHTKIETWIAANPGYGDICAASDFESAVKRTPEAEFRTKRCNQWVNTQSAWLPTGAWEKLSAEIALDPEEEYILGFDGSYANDSTALVAVTIPKADEKPKVFTIKVWEKDFERDDDSWRISINEVKDTIIETTQNYPLVREIVCDPYRWAVMMQELEEMGLPIVEFKTNLLNLMIPATQTVFDAILEEKLVHDGNPILARHIDNCVVKNDARGQRVTKESSTSKRKIDAAIAFIIALDRAMASRIDEGVPQFFV